MTRLASLLILALAGIASAAPVRPGVLSAADSSATVDDLVSSSIDDTSLQALADVAGSLLQALAIENDEAIRSPFDESRGTVAPVAAAASAASMPTPPAQHNQENNDWPSFNPFSQDTRLPEPSQWNGFDAAFSHASSNRQPTTYVASINEDNDGVNPNHPTASRFVFEPLSEQGGNDAVAVLDCLDTYLYSPPLSDTSNPNDSGDETLLSPSAETLNLDQDRSSFTNEQENFIQQPQPRRNGADLLRAIEQEEEQRNEWNNRKRRYIISSHPPPQPILNEPLVPVLPQYQWRPEAPTAYDSAAAAYAAAAARERQPNELPKISPESVQDRHTVVLPPISAIAGDQLYRRPQPMMIPMNNNNNHVVMSAHQLAQMSPSLQAVAMPLLAEVPPPPPPHGMIGVAVPAYPHQPQYSQYNREMQSQLWRPVEDLQEDAMLSEKLNEMRIENNEQSVVPFGRVEREFSDEVSTDTYGSRRIPYVPPHIRNQRLEAQESRNRGRTMFERMIQYMNEIGINDDDVVQDTTRENPSLRNNQFKFSANTPAFVPASARVKKTKISYATAAASAANKHLQIDISRRIRKAMVPSKDIKGKGKADEDDEDEDDNMRYVRVSGGRRRPSSPSALRRSSRKNAGKRSNAYGQHGDGSSDRPSRYSLRSGRRQ